MMSLSLGLLGIYLRNANVAAVLVLEEHDCRPVVGLVLHKAARCAGGKFGWVVGWIHGDVERVTSDNLMQMGRVLHPRVDKWVCSLDYKLRACKPQHVLSSNML